MPISLGKMEWGCQFSGGANFPVTPEKRFEVRGLEHNQVAPEKNYSNGRKSYVY